jgi:hypothetical protein
MAIITWQTISMCLGLKLIELSKAAATYCVNRSSAKGIAVYDTTRASGGHAGCRSIGPAVGRSVGRLSARADGGKDVVAMRRASLAEGRCMQARSDVEASATKARRQPRFHCAYNVLWFLSPRRCRYFSVQNLLRSIAARPLLLNRPTTYDCGIVCLRCH